MKYYFNYRQLLDVLAAIVICTTVTLLHFSERQALFIAIRADEFRSLFINVSSTSASLLGFILAANTFLVSHVQHRRLAMLRRSGGYRQLLGIMRSSLWRLFCLMIYSGVVYLVSPDFIFVAALGLVFWIVLAVTGMATLIWSTMATLSISID